MRRKTGMRRRRSTRGFTRGRRSWTNKAYTYKRVAYTQAVVTTSTLGVVTGSCTFSLASLPNYTEFTNLYDQYKINRVRVEFVPRASMSELGTGVGTVNFFTFIDYDDNTAPGSFAELLQRPSLKRTKVTSRHTRTLRPCVAKPIYRDGATFGYGTGRGWIDCVNPDVPHYGLKYYAEQIGSALATSAYDLQVTYYVSFKNVL